MSQGYIKLHRQLQECWLWKKNAPFDERSAWVDLLLLANHADAKVCFEGQVKIIHRGQFLTSILKLSERWKWDRKKTTRFLNLLENDEMVTTERTAHGTTISIVNWDKFQLCGATDGTTNDATTGTTHGTTHGTQTIIIKNDNNEKENKNKRFVPPTVSDIEEYCRENNYNIDAQRFVDFYESKGWMVGKNKMKDWKAAVRNWVRRQKEDGNHTEKEVDENTRKRWQKYDDLEKYYEQGLVDLYNNEIKEKK